MNNLIVYALLWNMQKQEIYKDVLTNILSKNLIFLKMKFGKTGILFLIQKKYTERMQQF